MYSPHILSPSLSAHFFSDGEEKMVYNVTWSVVPLRVDVPGATDVRVHNSAGSKFFDNLPNAHDLYSKVRELLITNGDNPRDFVALCHDTDLLRYTNQEYPSSDGFSFEGVKRSFQGGTCNLDLLEFSPMTKNCLCADPEAGKLAAYITEHIDPVTNHFHDRGFERFLRGTKVEQQGNRAPGLLACAQFLSSCAIGDERIRPVLY